MGHPEHTFAVMSCVIEYPTLYDVANEGLVFYTPIMLSHLRIYKLRL